MNESLLNPILNLGQIYDRIKEQHNRPASITI